jgi:hypothetical protein
LNQWRTQEIAKGGHFRGHEKLTTFFWEKSQGGAICPSTCFLVFFKPSKIIFRQPKGGAMDPWPHPSVRHWTERKKVHGQASFRKYDAKEHHLILLCLDYEFLTFDFEEDAYCLR